MDNRCPCEKDDFSFLLKLIVEGLTILLILLLLIIAAIPNMFYGYENSKLDSVSSMTAKAMILGGVYINLEDFEAAQVDAIITSLLEEYEEEGTEINNILIDHSFTKSDLIWVIAINSVAYQQNLNIMTPESVRQFVSIHLTYSYNLLSGETTTLNIRFDRLAPDKLMESLGFNEEEKRWAGAIQETLIESDALSKYESYYSIYRPNYGGDSNILGDVLHGSHHSNNIDLSRFVSPSTKNNRDLVAYAIQAWENNWGYVWGTYGNILTETLLEYKIEQYPEGVGDHDEFIRENWLERRTTDCVGLIKGYGWLNPDSQKIEYATNGMPDYGANAMHQTAVNDGVKDQDYGTMDTMPEIPGIALWKNGHIGIYIGKGYAIEAANTQTGVVKTKIEDRGWSEWCKIPYISYSEDGF